MTTTDTKPDAFDIDAAIEAVGDGLNAQGLDVRTFASDSCRHLKVDNVRSTVADLFIYQKGTVNWDYHSFDGTTHDPSRVTTITLAILADPGTPDSATVVRYPQMSFLGSVGRATMEQGLSANFSSRDPDNARFKIHDEVGITNPARPHRGTVQVTNDGALWWTCKLRSQPHSQDGLDLAEITTSIARALMNSQTNSPAPQRPPAADQSQNPAA